MSGIRVLAGLLALPLFGLALRAAEPDVRILEAVARADRQAVVALLRARADVNATWPDGSTALHVAAAQGDAALVSMLIDAGANVDTTNRYRVTPLVEAAAVRSGPVVSLLLRAGANANSTTGSGETVLMTAVHSGNVEAATALIEAGADVNATEGTRGQTALMWAAAAGRPEILRRLLASGADVSVRDRIGAAGTGRGRGGGGGGCRPPATGGMAALHYAAREGDRDAVAALLDAGADINQTDADGWTALHLATLNTHYTVAADLLERGADVNRADQAGVTPLYVAVDIHTAERNVAKCPARPERDVMTAVDLAGRMLARGAVPDSRLRRGGVGPGATAFVRAARKVDLPMMRLLLDHGADPLIPLENGTTALMYAAGMDTGRFGQPSAGPEADAIAAVMLCLERGADIHAVNDRGNTALHGAAAAGNDAVARLLVEKGARIDARNMQGLTPIDVADGGDGRVDGNDRTIARPATAALLRTLLGER